MMHKIKKNNGDQSVRPNNANTFDFQKEHWHQALADYDWASDEILGKSGRRSRSLGKLS